MPANRKPPVVPNDSSHTRGEPSLPRARPAREGLDSASIIERDPHCLWLGDVLDCDVAMFATEARIAGTTYGSLTSV
jgi:hypothetical protein